MSNITNLKELKEHKELKLYDKVIFTINEEKIEYEVKGTYLKDLSSNNYLSNNDKIFRILKLNKNKLAEKAYKVKRTGNPENDNYWPETKGEDYPALTKLVRELYTIIEEKEPKYTKYNRFEIMDI